MLVGVGRCWSVLVSVGWLVLVLVGVDWVGGWFLCFMVLVGVGLVGWLVVWLVVGWTGQYIHLRVLPRQRSHATRSVCN